MDEKNRRTLTPVLTVLGCLALLGALIALAVADSSGDRDENPAVGFPIVLVVLAVVALAGGFTWKALSKKKSDSKR